MRRPNGKALIFKKTKIGWAAEADGKDALVELFDASNKRNGWRFSNDGDTRVETFDVAGKLTSIGQRGLKQTLSYDAKVVLTPSRTLLAARSLSYIMQTVAWRASSFRVGSP